MPGNKHSEDDNQRGTSKGFRKSKNNIDRLVGNEVKRRIAHNRKATNQDGNRGNR